MKEEREVTVGSVVFHKAGRIQMLVTDIDGEGKAIVEGYKKGTFFSDVFPLAVLETMYQRGLREKTVYEMLLGKQPSPIVNVASSPHFN